MSCRAQTVRSFVQRRPIEKIPKEFPKAQFGSRETNPITSPAVLVTQEMIDEWEVQQEGFSIPQTPEGNLLKSAFSFMTTNDPPLSYNATNTTAIPVNWNGVTRILITPTMTTLPTEGIANKPVNGFKATMSALTLFGTTKIATFTNTGNTYEYNNLVEYQGVSYTVSVLTGQELLDELKATYKQIGKDTSKIVADALVYKDTTDNNKLKYKTGSSLVLQQGMDDINTQYEGTYAVQDIGSKTEPIWESCVIGGKINNYVRAFITNAGDETARATFELFEGTTVAIPTTLTETIAIPILAMIRVDFPEDLIQELYTDQVSETEIKLSMMNVAGQLAVEIGYGQKA